MTESIRVAKDGDIWTVTLNRPDKANALTGVMLDRLAKITEEARDARALILTGSGKIFSAGADLEDVENLATHPAWEQISANIIRINGLTIAALNGTVAGGAMGMMLACDLRIATPHAKAFYPVMRVGVLPQPSDPGRMAKLIGPARTKMILLAGEKVAAETALAWGLFDEIQQTEQLMHRAHALANTMQTANLSHVKTIKNAV